MGERDSSDHPVSVVDVVVVVVVNFFTFSTSSPKPLHGFASNFSYMFHGCTWYNVLLCHCCKLIFLTSRKPVQARICFKFDTDVPWVHPYQVGQ